MYGFLSYEFKDVKSRDRKKKKLKVFNGVGFGLFEMTKFVYIIVNVVHERSREEEKKAGKKKKSGNMYGTMFFLCIGGGLLSDLEFVDFVDFADTLTDVLYVLYIR